MHIIEKYIPDVIFFTLIDKKPKYILFVINFYKFDLNKVYII